MYRLLFFVMWMLTVLTTGNAQQLPMTHFTDANGLPGNIIYCTYRDSKGQLWFGTDKGLVLYNGIQFETLTTFDGAPDNEILAMREDLHQRLWVQTFNGVACFYKDGIFHTPANTPYLNFPIGNLMVYPETDSSATLLHFNSYKFANVQAKHSRMYQIPAAISSRKELIIHIQKLTPGTYKLLTYEKDYVFDTSGHILHENQSRLGLRTQYIITQQQQYIRLKNSIVTPDGLPVFPFVPASLTDFRITHCYRSGNNRFLCTIGKGLYINDQPPVLTHAYISGVTQDVAGNYWITTLNDGIYRIAAEVMERNIRQLPYQGQVKYAFTSRGSLFYASADNHLYRIRGGKTDCLLPYSKYRGTQYKIPAEAGFIYTGGIFHSFFNQDHCKVEALHAPVPRRQILPIIPDTLNGWRKEGSTIKTVAATPAYIYMMIAATRIVRVKQPTSTGTQFENTPLQNGLRRIYNIATDSSGVLWFNTNDTVYRMKDDRITPEKRFNGISFKRFYIFGQRLVGITHSNQLIVCQNIYNNSDVDTIPEQHCIWNRAYSLDDRRVLLSSNHLYRIITFSNQGGRPSCDITAMEKSFVPLQASYICSDSSWCYFFKDGMVTGVPVNAMLSPTPAPRVFFTHIKTGQQPVNNHNDSVVIPYLEARNITVSFSSLSFGSKHVSYEYSISGDNNDHWQDIRTTDINLAVPEHGKHLIKIRARTLSSGYSAPALLVVFIPPPFWATPWFKLAALVLFVTIGVFIAQLFTRYMIRKREAAHASEIRFMKLEYKALNALMNPHFIFNSLNNIQGLINSDDKRMANEYLRIFSNLIRQNMHNISKELISLEKEIALLHNYLRLEKLRFNDWLNYRIEIDEDVETEIIFVPPLLVQPLVENAVKHGLLPLQSPENMLEIHIYEIEEVLYIEVRDNGVGISRSSKNADQLHTSFALDNIRQRLSQLQHMHSMSILLDISDIRDREGNVCGTRALVTISYDKTDDYR